MNLHEIVKSYLHKFPSERDRLSKLNTLLEKYPDDRDLISRTNWEGHITASGFIISAQRDKVLLLLHKTIGEWLQPGGHIEVSDETPLKAAIREINGEVAFTNLDYLAYHHDDVIPIDIDTHYIEPLNGMPGHYHHDFRYAFLSYPESDHNINPKDFHNPEEKHEVIRHDLSELLERETYSILKSKLEKILSSEFRPKIFFDRVIKKVSTSEPIDVLVITHLLPDAAVFLRTVDKITGNMIVIPKPKSIDRSVKTATENIFKFHEATREQLQDDDFVRNFVRDTPNRVILFDIGGYFAPIVNKIKSDFPDKFVGVIEDTENGHQKYDGQKPLSLPVVSVARSPLKDNEDFLVGQSVLFSADAVLREVSKLIQYMDCSVFGYGKIGSSIAHHLLARGVKPSVYDINPIRRMAAGNRLCNIPPRDYIIQKSDVIFCATGSQVLNVDDFKRLKPGCVVFSVTSSDDEMDLQNLDNEYKSEDITEYITRYSSPLHHFFLVNKGNAVNFIHKAALGDFIHIVRAEMIIAADLVNKGRFEPGLHELDVEDRSHLADLWLSTFIDEPTRIREMSLTGI